jgi:hypothetical protein
LQYASEEFEDLWRVVHIHCRRPLLLTA